MPLDGLPNLGAEEGDDWAAYRSQSTVRTAARLWSLLWPAGSQFRLPTPRASAESRANPTKNWSSEACDPLWPAALGQRPSQAVYPWLDSDRPLAWLNTPTLEARVQRDFGIGLAGPPAALVARLHDKAWAVETARSLDLMPAALDPLIEVLDPDAMRSPDELVARLDGALAHWPEWTGRRYTLKPRFGSTGRGRIGGQGSPDTKALRGAVPRFVERGGAILEPWLDREIDLSVVLHVPPPARGSTDTESNFDPECVADPGLPTLIGSLEMLATPSGVFRGHCGELDSRGRVFSGHPDDETLRGDAAAIAAQARLVGFHGPCGVDGFRFREGDRSRLRPLVEFNARMTMGLVTAGLVRRALPRVRERLALEPGQRRAFLLALPPAFTAAERLRLLEACGSDAVAIDLGRDDEAAESNGDPRPILVFGPRLASLRRAHLDVLGC